MPHRQMQLATLGAILGAVVFAKHAQAQAPLSEGQVKAALVFNFARYVEWPVSSFASPSEPLSLCLLGRDKLGGALSGLESKQVNGRSLRYRMAMTLEDARGCHILFISESEERRLVLILKGLDDASILTISDMGGFVEAGGAIGIVQGETRLQFDINRRSLDAAKLKASSNLLKLARNLAERPERERSDSKAKN